MFVFVDDFLHFLLYDTLFLNLFCLLLIRGLPHVALIIIDLLRPYLGEEALIEFEYVLVKVHASGIKHFRIEFLLEKEVPDEALLEKTHIKLGWVVCHF
jgi:hypothetical protein